MRFVQVTFDNKDFVGMTENTHKDPFVALHQAALLLGTPEGNRLIPFKTIGNGEEYVDQPLMIPTGACIILEFQKTGKTFQKYKEALSGLVLPPAEIAKPRIISRMN